MSRHELPTGTRVRLLGWCGPSRGALDGCGTVVAVSDDHGLAEGLVYTVRPDPRPEPSPTTVGFTGDGGPPPKYEPDDWLCWRREIEPLSVVDLLAELEELP